MQQPANSNRMTRRQILGLAGGAAAAVLLAACQSAQQAATAQQSKPAAPSSPASASAGSATGVASGPATSGAPAPASAAPKPGGTLKFGIVGDFTTLDGHVIIPNLEDTVWQVWDRLTAKDPQNKPQPMLAESFDQSADGKQLTLKLRKGVTFHTGRELTSDDVKWNLTRSKDPKVGFGILASLGASMKSFDTPDKYTVVLNSDTPWPAVYDFLEFLNILDPETMQGPDAKTKAVGTGPFVWTEYAPGDHVRLTKNKNYWRSGAPLLDEINVAIQRDPQAMITQLQAGALDIADSPQLSDVVTLQKDPKFQVVINPYTGGWNVLALNATAPPTNNKQVRQALNYALDRQRIAQTVFKGVMKPEDLPWPPISAAYEAPKVNAYPFDLDKAKSLIASSGVPNVAIDINTGTTGSGADIAQIYQEDLAKIGVKATIKPADPVTFQTGLANHSLNGVIVIVGFTAQLHPATVMLGPYYSPFFNYSGYKDDAYTALVNQATTETDPTKAKALYSKWNDYVLDQSWILVECNNAQIVAAQPKVKGIAWNMHEGLDLSGTGVNA